ncbi:MAG TPA: PAS domain S-box protein, partial [Methanotrichaceae archaeon]|nr:PAS domain S-box protein [Methanotrichaceae archaeon]
WSPINSPVLNPDGTLAYILHRVENVTEYVLQKQQGIEEAKLTDALRERAVQMEADLYSRSHEAAKSSTKLKAANEELARHREHLEVLVKERTARLVEANVQLQAEIAERRKAEEALKTSGEQARDQSARLQAVLDAAPAIIWTALDPECRNISGNRAAYEFSRVSEGADMSKTGSEPERLAHYRIFKDGIELAPEEMPIQRVAASGHEINNCSLDFRFDDGTVRSVLGNVRPILNSKGQMSGAVAAFMDITEHKRAEERLAYQANLFANITDVIYSTDEQLRLTSWNHAAEKVYGWKEEEVLGRSVVEVTGSRFDPEMRSRLAGVLAETGSVTTEIEHTTKTGKRVIFESKTMIIRDAGGKVAGFIAVNRDITQRKRAEEALRESEMRLCSVLDNSRDVIYRLNLRTGSYEYISPSCETMVGYSPDELMALDHDTSLAMIHPDDLPAMRAALARFEDAGIGELEYRQQTKNGDYRWVSNHMSLIKDSSGQPLYRDGNIRDITQRKLAEEALLEKDANMQAFFNAIAESLILTDSAGIILAINETAAQRLGRNAGDVVGTRLYDLLGDAAPGKKAWADEVRRTCRPVSFEDVRNGRIVDQTIYPILSEDGKIARFAIFGQDITERKRSEEELRYHAGLVDNVSDAIISTDRDLKIRSWNKAAERIYGWQANEVVGLMGSDILQTTFPVELNREAIARDIFEKGGWEGELIQRTKDGKDITVHARSMALKDEAGDVIGGVSISSDITERKKAEKEIEHLASFPQLNPNPVLELDSSGRVSFANSATSNVLGELCLDCASAFLPDDLDAILNSLRKGEDETFYREVKIKDRIYGEGIYLSKKLGVARIYASEITERKRAEEALKKARDELELRVRKRTADLAKTNEEMMKAKEDQEVINEELQVELEQHQKLEAELIRAKDQALEAVEAKAAFLANMSHELRTPMNAVIGFSSLLMDDSLTPDQKDYVERIRIGGESLLAIINDILDLSKMEKKKVELEHRPLSLHALVEESLSMVAPAAAEKGLNLAYTINYGTPEAIVGDLGRIRQVLVNLLSNAVKFTDQGDVSVSISSKAVENKHQILFTVRDTGIGIPEDFLDRLFQPFSQAEASISSQRGGTGLGLAISKRLVELMGGKIRADSIPGEGSTFSFTIEAEAAPGEIADSEMPANAAYENLADKKPMRILVAEDVPSNQKVIVEMLRRMGYRADMAADGREVLQALELLPYDLILMDVKMPEMDGLEAARQIRKRFPAEKQPRIIAITAYALEGDREKCLEAGMDDYIAKPVKKDDLAALLRNITPHRDED